MALEAAVIGGGISGLAAAFRVAALGHHVTLFESEDFLGGLGASFPYRDRQLERFYHCILPDDHALLRLIREIGLAADLEWKRVDMGFMYEGKLYALNTAMDLLRFEPLSLIERVRLGLMGLRIRSQGLRPELDNITAADWVRGQVGARAFDVLWKPLLSAKIGDEYLGLPALWLTTRMSREKNTKLEVKGCLTRGYRSLIDALETALQAHGADIRLRTRVEAIVEDGDGLRLRLAGGGAPRFDFVVSTSPLSVFQRMSKGLCLPAKVTDLRLDYQGVISGVFLMEQPLTRYYWMPWVDSGTTSQGAVEMSNLVPLDRAHGLRVTYLVNYTHRDSALFRKSDAEILALYRADLERLYPKAAATVREQFLFRAPFVEPIWTVGYNALRPATSLLPGRLYLACTAQVYPRVNSWNSCCQVVDEMMPALHSETATRAVEEVARVIYVILPAWNEERTIRATLLALWKAMSGRDSEYRAVLVNDGSSDRTVAEAEAAVLESGGALPLTVIGHETNRGLGAGLCTGLHWCIDHAADEDVVVTLDADNTHPAGTIPALVEKIGEGYDIVIASRYCATSEVRGVPAHRLMLSDGARVLFRVLYPIPGVRDYTCCFRAFRMSLLRRARAHYGDALCTAPGFEAVMDLLLRLAALRPRVAEVGFTLDYGDRVGFSKMKVAKTIRSTVGLLLRRRWERMADRRHQRVGTGRVRSEPRSGAAKL